MKLHVFKELGYEAVAEMAEQLLQRNPASWNAVAAEATALEFDRFKIGRPLYMAAGAKRAFVRTQSEFKAVREIEFGADIAQRMEGAGDFSDGIALESRVIEAWLTGHVFYYPIHNAVVCRKYTAKQELAMRDKSASAREECRPIIRALADPRIALFEADRKIISQVASAHKLSRAVAMPKAG